MKTQFFCDGWDPEREGTKLLQNSGNYVPVNTLQQASVTVFTNSAMKISYLTSC